MGKRRSGQMTFWANVLWANVFSANVFMGRCQGQKSSGQMSLWANVVWANVSKGAFPPSHFCNKLDDKLAYKVAPQTNFLHFCLVCQSEVCCKPNWFATNSVRQLCKRVCHQVCCKNVMVETHLKQCLWANIEWANVIEPYNSG
jgi:hypothetical protein